MGLSNVVRIGVCCPVALASVSPIGQTQTFDVLIRGGQILDGSGNPWFSGDVGITGDRIAAVGRLPGATATLVIDAAALVVSPGFIDTHTHSARMRVDSPRQLPKRALLPLAFLREIFDFGFHLTIRTDGGVKHEMSQNIIGVSSADKSEAERRGLFQEATAARQKAAVVCLWCYVPDAAALAHRPPAQNLV